MDLSRVQLDLPYPEVEPIFQPIEARKLQNDYSGRDGELTAILQYSFQYYVLGEDEVGCILKKLALIEMKHHELLGEAIHNLGGYPVMGGKNYPWSGAFVNYAGEVKKMLELDIKGEEEAILNYERTLLQLNNTQAKALVERIIRDEELHVVVLKELLNSV